MCKVKIFGERNTATNAVKRMIVANASAEIFPGVLAEISTIRARILNSKLGQRLPPSTKEAVIDGAFAGQSPAMAWKHTNTRFEDVSSLTGTCVILCVRHPASWVLGLHRRPYHALQRVPESLPRFVETPWKTVRRDQLDRAFFLPAELWNTKARSVLHLAHRLGREGISHAIIHQETMAFDQRSIWERLIPLLGVQSTDFRALVSSTKDRNKTLDSYADYYGAGRWRDEIPPEVHARLDSQIDWDIAARLGYRQDSALPAA